MASLEELRKNLIREESFEEKDLIEFGTKINDICELDKDGLVNFKKDDLSDKERIKFALIARFISRKIEDFFDDSPEESRISPTMLSKDFDKVLDSNSNQIRARISDLKKEGVIKCPSRGTYQINPLKIRRILNDA